MRSTNSNGNTEIYLPKDIDQAINKLASLGSLGAARQWEQAALVSLICESKGRGRPSKKTTNVSSFKKMSIDELARKGVYGLKSKDAIRAYLRAWEISGQPPVMPGVKIELPSQDFPDISDLYTVGAAPAPAPIDEADEDDDTEDEDEVQDEPSPRPQPQPKPTPERDALSGFLNALDKMDPSDVISGQKADRVHLLIKTLDSWLDSLRELAIELDKEDDE
jgi:hypothetical protein